MFDKNRNIGKYMSKKMSNFEKEITQFVSRLEEQYGYSHCDHCHNNQQCDSCYRTISTHDRFSRRCAHSDASQVVVYNAADLAAISRYYHYLDYGVIIV